MALVQVTFQKINKEGVTMEDAIVIKEPMRRAVYNARDIRDLTGLSLPTVYQLMNRADFPSITVGMKRKFVPIEAFHQWLDTQAANKASNLVIGRRGR